jgi:hypothetical protein
MISSAKHRIDQRRLCDKVLLCASQASLTSWWVDGEINRAFQKEAQIMKERAKKQESTPQRNDRLEATSSQVPGNAIERG